MEIHIHAEKGEQIWINNTPIEEEVEEEPLTKRIMDAIDKYGEMDINQETAENWFHVTFKEFLNAIAEIYFKGNYEFHKTIYKKEEK